MPQTQNCIQKSEAKQTQSYVKPIPSQYFSIPSVVSTEFNLFCVTELQKHPLWSHPLGPVLYLKQILSSDPTVLSVSSWPTTYIQLHRWLYCTAKGASHITEHCLVPWLLTHRPVGVEDVAENTMGKSERPQKGRAWDEHRAHRVLVGTMERKQVRTGQWSFSEKWTWTQTWGKWGGDLLGTKSSETMSQNGSFLKLFSSGCLSQWLMGG
jgi:hypothetical protein